MNDRGAARLERWMEPVQDAPIHDLTGAKRQPLPALSVIVVNYNAGPLLLDCVRSVLASDIAVEVCVSDNGSTDDSLEHLCSHLGEDPRVRVTRNAGNLGFAGANNRVLGFARAPFVLFLNPDCVVPPKVLGRMLSFMAATPEAGLAGCTIRNPDGSEQIASRRAIPDPWIGLVRLLCLEWLWPSLVKGKRLDRTDEPMPSGPVAVEALSGAFMLVRRAALDRVGPLDEGYFLHCEDLDWFVRFARAGWQIYLIPDVHVVHHKGACSAGRPIWVEWHKHRGMIRFFRKFQYDAYPLPLSLMVIIGIWIRFGLVLLRVTLQRVRSGLAPGRQ